MEPWQSWAIVGVVGAGAAYYYSQSGTKGRGRGGRPPAQSDQRRNSIPNIDNREKRKKDRDSGVLRQSNNDAFDASTSSTQADNKESSRKRKAGRKQPSKLVQSSGADAEIGRQENANVPKDDEDFDEGIDNVAFAKQLSDTRTGTALKKPATTGNKKARKQNKRNQVSQATAKASVPQINGGPHSHDPSTASSTTGADADDDLSSMNSPEFGATAATSTTAPSATDVSDMLEPSIKGPSVLRLTEPVNAQPVRSHKPQKPAAIPETKKQRQNRQKNEEKKALRDQAEQERRVLLENQRRTVREAEGRPAKNGLGPPQASTKANAWSDAGTRNLAATSSNTRSSNNAPLLDTFDQSTNGATKYPPKKTHKADPTSEKQNTYTDLPPEEEQMRLLSEMDSDNSWNKVEKGGKSKKKAFATNDAASSSNGGEDKQTSEDKKIESRPVKGAPEQLSNQEWSAPTVSEQSNGLKGIFYKAMKVSNSLY